VNEKRRLLPEIIKKPLKSLKKGETIFKRLGNIVAMVNRQKIYVQILTNIHGKQVDSTGRPMNILDYINSTVI